MTFPEAAQTHTMPSVPEFKLFQLERKMRVIPGLYESAWKTDRRGEEERRENNTAVNREITDTARSAAASDGTETHRRAHRDTSKLTNSPDWHGINTALILIPL